VLVDDNAEFPPQPESPRMSAVAATPSALAQPAIRPLEPCFLWGTFGRTGVIFPSAVKEKIVRNLNIGITFASGVWRSSQPMQKARPSCNEELIYMLPWLTVSRIASGKG
jgi:hypothetical protein